ncbi:MAG: methyltransferase domain-containing protein [Burkholderiales bacterium]|nr:methyltransferase domain-containing protein [Burkholderiales bacterium]
MKNLDHLQHWFLHTAYGRYTLTNERLFYHNSVQNIFGYYSLQIGLSQINFLQGNKITNHYTLPVDIKCDFRFLPFASNSIDLIVCPHSLEFIPNYHHFLQECYRVLIPDGKIILSSFNSHFIFKFFKSNFIVDANKFINLNKLKNQLEALNFRIVGGKFFSYRPVLTNPKTLTNLFWLDKIGDRWLPTLSNSFGIIAIKEIITPNIIGKVIDIYPQNFSPNLGNLKCFIEDQTNESK